MAEHLPVKDLKVSGHLEERRGIYRIILSWMDAAGKRNRKSVPTGLAVKGNKKNADNMLYLERKKQSQTNLPVPTVFSPSLAVITNALPNSPACACSGFISFQPAD
jgi:hypothetical protein